MPLSPGTRIGAYEITERIGAGGMGEVYKAFDRTLNRHVAVKILADLLAADPDRLLRFEREAQVLAALNHSHVAHVYGFETSGPMRALVMELVEGRTLEERIATGPLALDDAISIARQLAEGLEAAHDLGIVHRDLKPANIKIREDGSVKILDFGLAKALAPIAAVSSGLQNSPTLTAQGTAHGIVLGTASYMSPEQAKGKQVDRRADIWAFGVVCYEMLTGRRLFDGEGVSDIMAAVLRQPVDFAALPAATPPAVRALLERCLERDLRQRLRDSGEARIVLEHVLAGKVDESKPAAAYASRSVLPWVIASMGVVAALATLFAWAPWKAAGPSPPTKIYGGIGADATLAIDAGPAAVLSPDGRTVVFRAHKDGITRLYVRRLDQLEARPLGDTEDATSQFFSPDGKWIGFFAGRFLKKVSVEGGAAITLCEAAVPRGATWADDNSIVFQTTSLSRPLLRVSADGGDPVPASKPREDDVYHRWPQALPDGRGLLYTANTTTGDSETATLQVQTRPGEYGKVVLRGGYHGRYLASGHLVYIQRNTLYAVRFDLQRLEVVGQAVPVVEGVAAAAGIGGAQYSVGANGLLVYIPGREDERLSWMTADGKVSPLGSIPPDWASPSLSPEGTQLAIEASDGRHRQIWIFDPARNQLRQLTFDDANHRNPVWTPNAQRVIYASDSERPGVFNIYWRRADGTGDAQRLTDSPASEYPSSVLPSGRVVAFSKLEGESPTDIWILPLEGDEAAGWKPGKPSPLVSSPATEASGAFSPDGRWIAYSMNERGRFEVYVRPYPAGAGLWRVSTNGGTQPVWSRKSQELFYSNYGQIMVAGYKGDGASFEYDNPRSWSPVGYTFRGPSRRYDVYPDGKRVVVSASNANAGTTQDRVVFWFNFLDELQRLLPRR